MTKMSIIGYEFGLNSVKGWCHAYIQTNISKMEVLIRFTPEHDAPNANLIC